jgi:hypothetical protein
MDRFQRTLVPTAAALAGGLAAWIALQLLSGRREAWDSPLYATLLWPLTVLGAAWLGARHGRSATLWLAAWVVGQSLGLLLANGLDDLFLWPVGLALLSLAHLPAWLLARHMARRRERRTSPTHG